MVVYGGLYDALDGRPAAIKFEYIWQDCNVFGAITIESICHVQRMCAGTSVQLGCTNDGRSRRIIIQHCFGNLPPNTCECLKTVNLRRFVAAVSPPNKCGCQLGVVVDAARWTNCRFLRFGAPGVLKPI